MQDLIILAKAIVHQVWVILLSVDEDIPPPSSARTTRALVKGKSLVRGLVRVSASENQMWPASPTPHSLPHSLLLPIDLVWMAACQPMFPAIEKRVKITGTSCRKWNFNSSSPFIHWCERLPSRGEGSIVFRQRSRFSKRRINRKERGKNTPAFLWLL